MLNKVILIGRLANDPELKWTPSGIPVTTFRLAVDRPMSAEARQSGQEKQADFIDIVAWRQAAEFASNYLGKGRLVAVDGRLQIRQYVAADGTNRRVAEVVVDQLKSLDRPREAHPGGPDEPANRTEPAHRESSEYGGSGRSGDRPALDTRRPPAGARPAPAAAGRTDAGADVEPSDAFADIEGELDDPFADE
jgi:single-strand DNA-binding protein